MAALGLAGASVGLCLLQPPDTHATVSGRHPVQPATTHHALPMSLLMPVQAPAANPVPDNGAAASHKGITKEERLARLKESGGTPAIEDAVVKALQYLKKTQQADGSWPGGTAYTGFALLAYLGHGETPASAEFGDSGLRAITYLVKLGMKQGGKLALDTKPKHWPYEQAIATYALAESAAVCTQLKLNVPNLREITQKAGQFVIDNQNTSGGWDYNYSEHNARGGDLSITVWHMLALKACTNTGLEFRNLQQAVAKALEYGEKLQVPSGGFGYSGPGSANPDYYTLTGAGMLTQQIWDRGSRASVRSGAVYIAKQSRFEYNTSFADLYGHFFESQAMLNRGGEQWRRYSAMTLDQLLANQNPDGSWKVPGGGKTLRAVAPMYVQNAHFRTCLCTLMLEVYYHYLPTVRPAKAPATKD